MDDTQHVAEECNEKLFPTFSQSEYPNDPMSPTAGETAASLRWRSSGVVASLRRRVWHSASGARAGGLAHLAVAAGVPVDCNTVPHRRNAAERRAARWQAQRRMGGF